MVPIDYFDIQSRLLNNEPAHCPRTVKIDLIDNPSKK